MNRWLLVLSLSLGTVLWAQAPQEPAPGVPEAGQPAALPQEEAAPAGQEEPSGQATAALDRRQVRFNLKTASGNLTKYDPQTQTFEIVVKEQDKKPEVLVFSFGPKTRLFAADRKVSQLKQVPLGTPLMVNYATQENGSLKANRIVVNPKKAKDETKPGGTGD